MRTLIRFGWAALLAGCSFSVFGPDAEPARLDEPFTLAPGESVRVWGTLLDVTFVAVTGDSRCPEGAECVWEGDAAVAAEMDLLGETSSHTLHTSGDARLGPRSVERGGYRLELEALEPSPRVGAAISPSEYRATLRVTAVD